MSPAWARAAGLGLKFRAAQPADLPFLFHVYASTRTAELAATAWTETQKAQFLSMQAQAQHADYGRNYPDAERWVIDRDGAPVGRLYLDRRESANHILDIALLPEARGRGFGGVLLADLIDEAAEASKAKRLYERLGFVLVEERTPYLLMRRDAAVR